MIHRLPFVGFVIFFAMGILIGQLASGLPEISLYFVFGSCAAFGAFTFLLYRKGRYTLISCLFALFLVFSGGLSVIFQNQYLNDEVTRIGNVRYSGYEAVVKSLPEKRKKTLRIEVTVKNLRTEKGWLAASTKALVNIPLDAPAIPAPGDHIVVSGKLDRPKAPLNPGEFDYRKYLWNKGIVWTGYLPEGSYEVIKGDQNKWNPAYWSIYVSEWADAQFRVNLPDNRAYGLVKAMLLGRRDDLRTDQVDDYTTSGTVHILSVSGMHVALIFWLISMLFGWMKKRKGGQYIYLVTVVTLLVFYSFVTGFPPTVQRATVMCIVLVIAEVFRKKHSSVNSLAVSAFLILLLDPLALYDVGFQLSYLAMLGIFLFYKPIENIWIPSGWLAQKIWQVTALSFAAQLTTFPISIYYFHQFPSYFWLVNPFVIALTNALLPAAMVLLLFSFLKVSVIQWVINQIVWLLAYLTNISAAVPKSLPGFVIENLYLDRAEVLILYIVLLLIWYAYASREVKWFKMSVLMLTLFAFYAVSVSVQTFLESKAVFHAVPRHNVISFKDRNKLYIASDGAFVTDTNAYNFYIKNYAVSEGVEEHLFLSEMDSAGRCDIYQRKIGENHLFEWKGKTIFMGSHHVTDDRIDYHVLTGVKYPRNNDRFAGASNALFLLGGDIRPRTAERWKQAIVSGGYRLHDLWSDGALLLH